MDIEYWYSLVLKQHGRVRNWTEEDPKIFIFQKGLSHQLDTKI